MRLRSLIFVTGLVCMASPVVVASDINKFIGQQVVEIEFV